MSVRRWRLCAALAAVALAGPTLQAQDAPHHRQAREIFERLISFCSSASRERTPRRGRSSSPPTWTSSMPGPVMANELTRAYLGLIGKTVSGREGELRRRFAANPQDHEADDVRKGLVAAIANLKITVEAPADVNVSPVSEPRADVTAAITRSIHRFYPGIPVSPCLESGGTDGLVYRSAGIPTYASSGIFMKASDVFAHGLNERIPVASFYQAVDHIYDVAASLGGMPGPASEGR